VSDPTTSGSTAQTLATRLTVDYTGITFGTANSQASASGLAYAALKMLAHTMTITGTTHVTAAAGAVYVDQVTLTDASSVTVDTYASLYIKGAPIAASSV